MLFGSLLTFPCVLQFSVRIFWEWVVNALVHSLVGTLALISSSYVPNSLSVQVIYIVTACIEWDELILPQGWVGGQWVWGTTLYLGTLLTVLAKAALISEYAPPCFSHTPT